MKECCKKPHCNTIRGFCVHQAEINTHCEDRGAVDWITSKPSRTGSEPDELHIFTFYIYILFRKMPQNSLESSTSSLSIMCNNVGGEGDLVISQFLVYLGDLTYLEVTSLCTTGKTVIVQYCCLTRNETFKHPPWS